MEKKYNLPTEKIIASYQYRKQFEAIITLTLNKAYDKATNSSNELFEIIKRDIMANDVDDVALFEKYFLLRSLVESNKKIIQDWFDATLQEMALQKDKPDVFYTIFTNYLNQAKDYLN